MQSPIIKFGTDGWRGRIADTYTFDSVRRCAYGFAQYMLHTTGPGATIVVGYDKRFSSENFASAVAEVLAANDLKVMLTDGPTPTPTISFSVVANDAAAVCAAPEHRHTLMLGPVSFLRGQHDRRHNERPSLATQDRLAPPPGGPGGLTTITLV